MVYGVIVVCEVDRIWIIDYEGVYESEGGYLVEEWIGWEIDEDFLRGEKID